MRYEAEARCTIRVVKINRRSVIVEVTKLGAPTAQHKLKEDDTLVNTVRIRIPDLPPGIEPELEPAPGTRWSYHA